MGWKMMAQSVTAWKLGVGLQSKRRAQGKRGNQKKMGLYTSDRGARKGN